MKMLSKLFKILGFITYIVMIITVIVVPSDANMYEYLFYEIVIFLLFSYSKCIVDAKILERKIKKEMWKLEEKELNRSKSDENT